MTPPVLHMPVRLNPWAELYVVTDSICSLSSSSASSWRKTFSPAPTWPTDQWGGRLKARQSWMPCGRVLEQSVPLLSETEARGPWRSAGTRSLNSTPHVWTEMSKCAATHNKHPYSINQLFLQLGLTMKTCWLFRPQPQWSISPDCPAAETQILDPARVTSSMWTHREEITHGNQRKWRSQSWSKKQRKYVYSQLSMDSNHNVGEERTNRLK